MDGGEVYVHLNGTSFGAGGITQGNSGGGGSNVTLYTQEELEAMTVNEIKAIAEERGYSITATLKADIIQQFLTQQNG